MKNIITQDLPRKLSRIKYIYDNLLDTFLEDKKFKKVYDKKEINFFLCGGVFNSVLDDRRINDLDIFSNNPKFLEETLNRLKKKHYYKKEDYVTCFNLSDFKVQIIYKIINDKIEELFSYFDFTISMAGYDGVSFYCHERFWQDIATKSLVYINFPHPLSTFERTIKYANRGYKPCNIGLLNLCKEIAKIDFKKSNSKNEDNEFFEFYPDKSVRFVGVD